MRRRGAYGGRGGLMHRDERRDEGRVAAVGGARGNAMY